MDLKLIAENIKYLRKSNNLSRKQLAKLINYAHSSVFHYENQHCEPKLLYIYKMSKQFNVSIDDILNKKLNGDINF